MFQAFLFPPTQGLGLCLQKKKMNFARQEVEAGPVQAPDGGKNDKKNIAILGEMFPADPMVLGAMIDPLGFPTGPVLPARESHKPYAALDCQVVF
jgi:Uncharacterized protein conserved in bacteria